MAIDEPSFTERSVAELPVLFDEKKGSGARFVNLHAKQDKQGNITLVYSFCVEGDRYENFTVPITPDQQIPSITGLYPAAFFFENETHDLFGVEFKDIVLDFGGAFYTTNQDAPMTHTVGEGVDA